MSSKKIRGVTDFPMLGLTNYFRDHVPNHSNVVAPLHKMIDHAAKKQSMLIWTDDAANSFQKTKDLTAKSPLLYFIHDTAPITLMTDASDYGMYQEVDGEKQLIALVSKSLTKTQLKWPVIQIAAYTVIRRIGHKGYWCCIVYEI